MSEHEKNIALRNGHEIAQSEAYFLARPNIDTKDHRAIFEAGFNRGWESAHVAITRLQSEVEALRKDAEWQPIEKAPKDGSEILVAFKSVGVKCVSWTDREWDSSSEFALWCVNDNKFEPHPLRGYNSGDEIGWMPLPKSPTAIAKDTQLTALSEMVRLSEELGLCEQPLSK
jgi:hypothetical protein